MSKVSWFYNRLKAMTPAEVSYRAKKMLMHKVNEKKYKEDINVYDIININIDTDKLYKNLSVVFDKIDIKSFNINNEYRIFNEIISLDRKINWHRGMTGIWEKDKSSYDIEFKNTDDIGDIRYSWEINRHQFMPYLAVAYLKTKDYKYVELLETHFEDWVENNKFLKGINWTSSMEIALRTYQWLIVVYLLKDIDNLEFKNRLIKSIIISIKYVMENLSLYSSANNHLVLEVAISSIIGYCVQDIYAQDWFKRGYNILKEEIPKQFHEDGVNKEQALHYQGFVTDMLLQYNMIMQNISQQPIHDKILKKSVEFISLLNTQSSYTDFGDSDDARIIYFNQNSGSYYIHILSLAQAYFKEYYVEKYLIETSLFKQHDDVALYKKSLKNKGLYLYKDGGYSIIKSEDITLLLDFGELGFGSLAAHGHADALMFLYNYKGNMFFIDSGTYIYNIEKNKRDYYRGTSAHNTLCFDSANQSEIKGPFLWGRKSNTKLINFFENKDRYILEASNDGYYPSIHRRRVEYFKANDVCVISDFFDKEAELNFILDSEVKVECIDDKIFKLNNGYPLYMYVDGKVEIKVTQISKNFLQEINSIKITSKYSFEKVHRTIICPDLSKIYELLLERESKSGDC